MNITELAKEAGFRNAFAEVYEKRLERFAALVRAEALTKPDIEEMTLTQIASRHEPVKQEPVAWALSHSIGLEFGSKYPIQETKEAAEQMARQHMGAVVVTPLYTAPVFVKREWVDLTCQEVTALIMKGAAGGGWQGFAERVQAAFKEKNK